MNYTVVNVVLAGAVTGRSQNVEHYYSFFS